MESEHVDKDTRQKMEVSILHIREVNLTHIGKYVCHKHNGLVFDIAQIILNVTLPPDIEEHSPPIRTKPYQEASLYCIFSGFPIDTFSWHKDGETITENIQVTSIDELSKNLTLIISEVTKKDNGTYTCLAYQEHLNATGEADLLVLDAPQVSINLVKSIGKSKIFVNWTVDDGNEPESLKYILQYKGPVEPNWIFYSQKIDGNNRSFVLRDMNDTQYKIRIQAENSIGSSQYSESNTIYTLSEDPEFIPEVKINGLSVNSITISWTEPPEELKDYIHYYELQAQADNSNEPLKAVSMLKDNIYMFSSLNAATNYDFSVKACSEFTNECGPWSLKVNVTTMDGISGPPSNVTVNCKFDGSSTINVSWHAPINPHGTITTYSVSDLFIFKYAK